MLQKPTIKLISKLTDYLNHLALKLNNMSDKGKIRLSYTILLLAASGPILIITKAIVKLILLIF